MTGGVVADANLESGSGQGELAQMSLHRSGELGRGLPPARPEPLLRLFQEPGRGTTTGLQATACLFRRFQLGQL